VKPIDPNLQMVERVAEGFGDLLKEVCFIGGATTSLYLDVPLPTVRPTKDVDCVVSVMTYVEQQGLERQLEGLGFKHCTDKGAPICRWEYEGILVDVMPSQASVLGFNNEWFIDGMKNSIQVALPSGRRISIFTVPYFFAAKIAAFKDRGKGDFYSSPDWEDVITVLAGRAEIRRDLYRAPKNVKDFIKNHIEEFSASEAFRQSIAGHLGNVTDPQESALRILDILQNIE